MNDIEFTVGACFRNHYPIYNRYGRIVAECLNKDDADKLAEVLNDSPVVQLCSLREQ